MGPLPAQVAARVAALHALLPAPAPGLRAGVADVVVIGSSSRGGSSATAELLRRSDRALHLRAELNPLLGLVGLRFPASGPDDALGADVSVDALDALGGLLSTEVGQPAQGALDAAGAFRYAVELAVRLSLQWPAQEFAAEEVHAALQEALPAGLGDPDGLWIALLGALRRRGHPIHPGLYDLDQARVAAAFPDLPPPVVEGPLIEEPPFVCPRPWRLATAEERGRLPLLIKTPSNAYRRAFLAALFPAARLRLLHLRRNPAASVNGLVDGWQHAGFHAHEVGGLSIDGYSHRPGGDRWWKFDLPPGWSAWTGAPLVEVGGFQWRSAHRALLDDWGDLPCHPVRFEDLTGAAATRAAALRGVAAFLGDPDDPALAAGAELPTVMATRRPRAARWVERAPNLEQVLARPDTQRCAQELGYALDRADWR